MSDFFRFPHTPHLAWLGPGNPRDDKVLSPLEAEALLSDDVVVEEKLDGANLGFSIDAAGRLRIQNRGEYLEAPYRGQFSRLSGWLAEHRDSLESALSPGRMLFGEWCAARHSVPYSELPDWFLGFDVYDKPEGRFWGTARRDALLAQNGIQPVPCPFRGHTNLKGLTDLLRTGRSHFSSSPMEGLVIRREGNGWLAARAKLVRADFAQAITEHWSRRAIEWNRLAGFARPPSQ